MRSLIKKLSNSVFGYDPEAELLRRWVGRLCSGDPGRLRVLDVGCGYGRNLGWLQQKGYQVLGVEANPAIVEANRKAGLPCVSLAELDQSRSEFDLIIMAHIVEHFAPSDLLSMLEHYLGRLRPGGHLLVATPLNSPYFFDDFDHVKPYQPTGFLMVFGGQKAQVQYYGKDRLELVDLWFRRSYFRAHFVRARYVRSWASRALLLADLASASVFRLTGGRFGRLDGWVGLFCKKAGA